MRRGNDNKIYSRSGAAHSRRRREGLGSHAPTSAAGLRRVLGRERLPPRPGLSLGKSPTACPQITSSLAVQTALPPAPRERGCREKLQNPVSSWGSRRLLCQKPRTLSPRGGVADFCAAPEAAQRPPFWSRALSSLSLLKPAPCLSLGWGPSRAGTLVFNCFMPTCVG